MKLNILDMASKKAHSESISHNGFSDMIVQQNIVPQFKPNYALELLYPLLADTRQVRDALFTARNGSVPSAEMALYTPADIEAIRVLKDPRFKLMREAVSPPIVSFRTSKGGVGKTTACANVAACAASLGYRVLMIDAAPQASLSTMFQVDIDQPDLKTMLHCTFHGVPMEDAMIKVIPNGELYLVPSDNLLAQFDYLAMPQPGREKLIAKVFERNKETIDKFDLVLIDCDPGTSQINLNVLVATSHLAVIIGLDGSSLKALEQLTSELNVVRDLTERVPDFFFIANRFYPTYQHTIENLQVIKEQYGDYLLTIQIPEAVAFSRQVKPISMKDSMPLFFNSKEAGKTPWRAIVNLTRTILQKTKLAD